MTTFVFQLPPAAPAGPSALPLDPTYGNIGLQGPSLVMLRLTESNGVRPADSAGNLADLAPVGDAPASAPAWTGRGRAFDAADETTLTAVDRPGRDTLSTRDVSLQAIVSIPEGDQGVLYTRGNGTPGDLVSFAVSLMVQLVGGVPRVYCYCTWSDTAGNIKVANTDFAYPGGVAGGFFLLTVTRRWESMTRNVVRIYAGEALVHQAENTGDVAGSTTSATWIGSNGNGGQYLTAVVDELRVADYEITHEEVTATSRRLAVYQPAGVAMLRGLLPPGVRWLVDPSSRIGRLMKIAGQALGYTMAKAEELRATWLPDRAYLDLVERWERIRGVAPRPRDSLDTRRARLAGLFQREHGYSVPKIQDALAPLLGVDPEDVPITEFTNTTLDAFDTLPDNRYWLQPAAADWSLLSGALRTQRATGSNLASEPSLALADLSSGAGSIVFQVKVTAAPAWPAGACVGIALQKGSGARSYLGLVFGSPEYALAERLPDGTSAVIVGPPVIVPPAWTPASPVWLRVYATAPGTYHVEYCLVPTLDAWHGGTVTGHVAEPDYAGPAVWGSDAHPGAIDVRFDDYLTVTPRGARPFYWYVPVDAGADVEGARHLVAKMKPAHTHATAMVGYVVCDNPDTPCDREPLAE